MDIRKVLRWSILAGIFVLPFIPLIVSSSMFFPFITGKNFTFRIIVEIIFGLWVILAFIDPAYRPKRSPILWSAVGVISALSISTFFAVNPYRAFWSNFERMDGLISHIHLFLYFLVAASVLTKEKLWGWLFGTSLAANATVAVYSFAQLLGAAAIHQSSTRLDATLGNASYLAIYMLFHVFLSAYIIFRNRDNKIIRYALGALIIIQLFVLYCTATRGTILGLIGGLLLGGVIVAFAGRGKSRKIALYGLAAIVFLIVSFFLLKGTSFVKNSPVLSRFASISMTETTTQSRFLIWKMSAKGFVESPKTMLVGWGLENYNLVFNKYYVPEMWRQEPWFDRSHNIFFDWLISAGVVGLVAYLALFVSALWVIWRGRPNEEILGKAMLTGLLAGYLFNNVFVFDNIVSYILFFSVLAYLHSHYLESRELEASQKKPLARKTESGPYAMLVAPAVFFLVCFSVYYFNIPAMRTANNLVYAISSRGAGSEQRSYDLFQQIFKDDTFGKTEAREQLIQYSLSAARGSTASPELKQKLLVLAYQQMGLQVGDKIPGLDGKLLPADSAAAPIDARYRLFFGSFLNSVGQFDQALNQLEAAKRLSPNKQAIRFEIANVYLNKGELGKAAEVFKEAYDLDHTYPEARNLYALILLMNNNPAEADKVLNSGSNQYAYADDRIAAFFKNQKNYPMLLKSREEIAGLHPEDVNAWSNLAEARYLLGDRAGAIEAMKKAGQINPSVKAAAEEAIKKIESGQPLF